MKNRRLILLLAGLLLAGCDAEHKRQLGALSEQPVFPNTPPKARPRPQAFVPGGHGYQHPVFRHPPPHDPNAPMGNPEVPARVVSEVAPEYTPVAQRARIAGMVILEVVVDADGYMSTARVLKPLPFGLDRKAIEAVRRWRFEPARHRGKPVTSFCNVTVRFRPPPASQ